LAYDVIPKQPVPNGVVPDPPNYTACIPFLAAFAPGMVEGLRHKLTPARLKYECQKRYEDMRNKAIGFLITSHWVSGEMADRGVTVTASEVKQQLERFVHHELPTRGEFHNYLTYTGMSVEDLSSIMRTTLLGDKLQEVIARTERGTTQRQAFQKFGRAYWKKWTSRTSCRAGYVMKFCKEYRGKIYLL
jgi:hypothetical protein